MIIQQRTRSPLLRLENVSQQFSIPAGIVQAVSHFNLEVYPGETVGLVGESGCGKSTVGRTILQLYRPSTGRIFFENRDLATLSQEELKVVRRRMQMVFQDPYGSLNPRMTVEEIIREGLDIHQMGNLEERAVKVRELLEQVGLKKEHAFRYPHEFSGGQRQRIGIARALAVRPKFIVCDEPISALDVSIQAQVINLLKSLQQQLGLAFLFIAHDLSMVQYISHRVAVMYLGHLVELAKSEDLYQDPLHPYTQALLSAVPIPNPEAERKRHRIVLKGEVPSPIHMPSGCVFHTRCPHAMPVCKEETPKWQKVKPHHFTACHLYS